MKVMMRVLALGAFALLCFVASASASIASSSWNLFHYATPSWPGIDPECGYGMASVDNGTPKGGIMAVVSKYTADCSQALYRDPTWLAVQAQIIKGTSGQGGVICADSGWRYNGMATWNYGYWQSHTYTQQCPAGAAYYVHGKAKIWWSDWSDYTVSGWIDSPNLNF